MRNIKSISKSIILALILFLTSFLFVGCDEKNSDNVWVAFDKSRMTLTVGQSEKLEVLVTPSNAKDGSYVISTNNPNVVSISQDGTVTALNVGTATVTVTSTVGANTSNCVVTVVPVPQTLATPSNISFDGEKIVWDRVENRVGYKIKLNDVEIDTISASEFFRGFTVGTENKISIKTIGNGSSYLDSEWSTDFIFTQLQAPVVNVSNGKIIFNSNVENAKYDLYLDGTLVEENIDDGYYIIPNALPVGTHIYKAKVIGNQSSNTYNSKFSEEVVITRLSAPTNAVVSASMLSFDAVIGAESYMMMMTDTATNTNTYQILNTNSYYLGEDYVAGRYEIKLLSRGNWTTTIDSDYSSSVAIDKLDAPTNLSISNGIITWEQNVAPRNGFLVNIYDYSSLDQNVQIIPTDEYFYNFAEYFKNPGTYVVTIVATGDDLNSDSVRYINSAESAELYITKLPTPKNVNVSNNYLNWNLVDLSSNYEILHGTSVTYLTTNNYFDFTNNGINSFSPGSHSVRVRAIGNGTNVLDSEYSDEISFIKLDSITKTDFTINQSTLSWTSIKNCIKYNIYINDKQPIEVNTNKFDMNSAEYNELNYTVRVQALSSTSEYVMGEPSEEFTFQKLGTATNLGVVNGKLSWSAPSGNGIISSYRLKIGGSVFDTHSNATTNDLHYYMPDGSTQEISVQAICNDNTNQFMWGNFSQAITLTKLNSNFNAKIINGEYVWNKIDNVSSYIITVMYSVDINTYSETMEFSANEDRSLKLLDLDFFEHATQYRITIQALGISGGQYISSLTSSPTYTTRLNEVQELCVKNGVINWEYDSAVDHYEVIINGESIGNIGRVDKFVMDTNYAPNDYEIQVFARGNQSTTLNAIETETPLSVTKLSNNFEISVDKNFVKWNKITNASSYSYELRDEKNIIVSNNDALLNNRVDLTNIEWNERYYLRVKANGDNTKFLNGDYSANSGEAFYIVKILNVPTNLSVDKGILSWDYIPNATDYEIKISNINNSDEYENVVNYSKTDTANKGSFDLASYAITHSFVGEIRIVIQCIGGVGEDAYLSSSYSDELRVYKLEIPTLSNVNGVINWSKVEYASSYKLNINAGGNNTEIELNKETLLYELGNEFPAGNYDISIKAMGDEQFCLTSNSSSIFSATKLATPVAGENDLRVKDGKIVWAGIPNAYLYKVDILKNNGLGSYSQYKTETLMPNNDDNSYLFNGDYGQYKMNIKVIGTSGTQYLNSNTYEYANVLTKLNAPSDMHVEKGVLKWSAIEGVTSNGYLVKFNNYSKNVGQVTSYVLDEEFASIQYLISITSLGDDTSKLTSDQSKQYSAIKISKQNFNIVDGTLQWEKDFRSDHYELVFYNINDLSAPITEEINIDENTFSLQDYQSGYYKAKIRFVSGDYTNSEIGYLNSDWSNEISIFKLQKAENFKLISDFESSDEEILKNLGTLTWDSVENAGSYQIAYKSNAHIFYDYVDDIKDTSYMFSDNEIDRVGAYNINLVSLNNDTIEYDNVEYQVIKSDITSIIATKLATPENLKAQNGCLYWTDPNMGDELQGLIDFKYIVYWSYADENSEFAIDSFESEYVGSGIVHNNVLNEESIPTTVRSHPLSKLGKYKLMLRAVGENCIRSDAIECQTYINYENTLTTHYLFDLFYDGDGTEENPFVIKSFIKNSNTRSAVEQLGYLNYMPNKNFILQENLTLDSSFLPIGTKDSLSTNFTGTLDGYKTTDSNYYIDATNVAFNSLGNVGVFNQLLATATVKNLDIKNMLVKGAYNVIGGVTSQNYGTIQNVNVLDFKATGTHTANNKMYVGGLVGINYGTISNCTTNAILNTVNTLDIIYAGGITGYNEGTIYQCRTDKYVLHGVTSTNQITGTMTGGIAGFNIGENASIQECSNYAMIKASTGGSSSGGISYGYAGGIVGKNAFNLDGNSSSVTTYPLVQNCYNAGEVCAFDNSRLNNSKAGGIIGFISGGKVAYSFNYGDVYIIDVDGVTKQYNYAGGVIGHNDSNNSMAENCYYMEKTYTQLIMPDSATTLNTSSANLEKKTEEWLKTNAVSDKFTVVADEMQKLTWEVA